MSNAIQGKLKNLKEQKSYSIPAKRVMEHLKPILSKSNDLKKRWMWELLQNASDLGDNIKARFLVTNDKLTFEHNGKPFTLGEAYNLIMPDSNKDEELSNKKSVIGQFGTGFISTHILSKNIEVSGIIDEDGTFYNFNFNLNRKQREDKDVLIQSIKDSEKEYHDGLNEIVDLPTSEFQTSFIYNIANTYTPIDGLDTINEGIKNLKAYIPYVFAFRPQLSTVDIIDNRNLAEEKFRFEKEEVENDIEGLKIFKTNCYKNDIFDNSILVGSFSNDDTSIAFSCEHIKNNKYRLLPFPDNCPRLFCAFPMIGSSNFNFPVIIHSEKFNPNRERDGIEINEFDTDNRLRLQEAINALKQLFKSAEIYNWCESYNICSLKEIEFEETETKKWFTKEVFTPVKNLISQTKLVEINDPNNADIIRRPLAEIYIPYSDKRAKNKLETITEIADFARKLIPGEIPIDKDIVNWYEALNFEIFINERLDIEKLCESVSLTKAKIADYKENFNIEIDCVVPYFVRLARFIKLHEKEDLFNKHALLINQNDELVKIKGLKRDLTLHKSINEEYQEKLKDIYFAISKSDCRTFLLNEHFEQIDGLLDKEDIYTFEELANDTDDELRTYNGNFTDESFLLILRDTFSWYTACGLSQDTLNHLFPYFSSSKSQLYLNTKSPEELEFAFDIEISGKSEVLAKLANSSLSESQLDLIVSNHSIVSSFVEWLNSKQDDNPDKELGNIGEEFLNKKLCEIFGEERVLWEDKPEYDFRILESDLTSTKYYIDAKTSGAGIANNDNVPFFMRIAQWNFLDEEQAHDKYIIARIFLDGGNIDVKYVKLNTQSL